MMPKNIVIYADGTGQAGGVRPDQRLSNIYKMYRATRTGPDSTIDPATQVAFYDAGLGTDDDAAAVPTRLYRQVQKTLGSVTGRGITRNIIDCYEHILDVYEPGDRIFLFGFSRGAYTARCIANLLALCGVPTIGRDGLPMLRYKPETRAIATEAVRKVYEHGAGLRADRFDAQRQELGRRFRQKYASGDAETANVHPYFVGVFDTVASLGAKGLVRFVLGLVLVLAATAVCALGAAVVTFVFQTPFWIGLSVLLALCAAAFAISSLRSTLHVIRHFPKQGDFSFHIAKWKMKNYDLRLPTGIWFARHAIAIDETRADFPRVKWGWKGQVYEPVDGEPERFIQLWFAGNHSDIGGSYPEDQSRLSDIALAWMIGEATAVPDPLLVDRSKLNMFPSPDGLQHCEVDAMRDRIAGFLPAWLAKRWKPTWKEAPRIEASGAPMHPSVKDRFELPGVIRCGRFAPYRPETLREDPTFKHYYDDEDAANKDPEA